MITYNDIYEALRKEKYSEQIQPLPKNFISEIATYLKEKKEIATKEKDIFSDAIIKTKKQLENAISIFRELILRRKKKLLNLAFVAAETGISKRDFENMLQFEKELFDKIMRNIEDSDKKLTSMMNGENKEAKHGLVLFKEDVEEFVGIDGNTIGPFKKGDIANLPKEIVRILMDAKKIESVDED